MCASRSLAKKAKQYADQEINYGGSQFRIAEVEGRTIHSDGTVIPFTGKPYQKLVEKSGNEKYKATVFTLPDVQVGSIIEYRYMLEYESNLVVAARWYLQGPLYTRKAHFFFLPTEHLLEDGHGGVIPGRVGYTAVLPAGSSVVYSPARQATPSMWRRSRPIPGRTTCLLSTTLRFAPSSTTQLPGPRMSTGRTKGNTGRKM